MPLLLIAVLTHIIYKAISNGLDWGGEASRKAWGASLAHSRSLADRLRQGMVDTLDRWDQDPRGRRYAATAVRLSLGLGRGLGKLGIGTALMTAKGVGAVSRALAGGALATGGLLGALFRAGRLGVRDGSEWWRRNHGRSAWRWADWVPSWAERLADRWWRWGDTIPGEAGPDPFEEDEDWGYPDDAEPRPSTPDPEPEDPSPGDGGSEDIPWDPWEAEPTAEPRTEWQQARPKAPRDFGPTTVEWGEEATTPGPTPVRSVSAGTPAALGTATAVLDSPARPAIEGADDMSTDLMPAQNAAVAPISNAADGMKYEQSLAFLAEQQRRALELGTMMEQLHALQLKVIEAAKVMANDHATAEAALARFRIQAPNVAEAISLLTAAANPAPAEHMVNTYMALDLVATGCQADATDLTTRFGSAWETFKREDADAQYVND